MSLVARSHRTYKDALLPTVFITSLFNSGAFAKSRCGRLVEKALFILLFFVLTFTAVDAVLELFPKFRMTGIDKWIQFSLFIVPLFSMICGHLIFKSDSFKEILNKPIGQNGSTENETDSETSTFDSMNSFLRKRSLRTSFYPLSLVLYQWTVFMIFVYYQGSTDFYLKSFSIRLLYYPTFWVIAMYISGFVGFCFILVVDVHKLDIKSFLFKIGNGPLIQKRTSLNYHSNVHYRMQNTNHGTYGAVDIRVTTTMVTTPVGFCSRVLSLVTGFLTLGLVELASGQPQQMSDITGCEDTQNNAGSQNNEGTQIDLGTRNDAGENSRITNVLSGLVDVENGNEPSSSGQRGGPPAPKNITPREASQLLIELMSSLETNSSLFKPFLVLLTFFSVTNLVTHVVAMAVVKINNFTALHWWTFVCALFWFLLAIRLLWTVATITNALSRIIPHIYYLRSVGQLKGSKQEWDDFFNLLKLFSLVRGLMVFL